MAVAVVLEQLVMAVVVALEQLVMAVGVVLMRLVGILLILLVGMVLEMVDSKEIVTTPSEIIPYYHLNHSFWSLSDNKEVSR
jgi:hypothetical protein